MRLIFGPLSLSFHFLELFQRAKFSCHPVFLVIVLSLAQLFHLVLAEVSDSFSVKWSTLLLPGPLLNLSFTLAFKYSVV